jgi:hypothetical protein
MNKNRTRSKSFFLFLLFFLRLFHMQKVKFGQCVFGNAEGATAVWKIKQKNRSSLFAFGSAIAPSGVKRTPTGV